ncbi:MAG: anaerobic glycerol-3-phosphate dehydrogenase subunit GlpB [Candidatus Dormibacteria bacterium]
MRAAPRPAGMIAGIRLAQEGLDVLVLASGQGGIPLSPGVIDVLGYAPQRVVSPGAELGSFLGQYPEHPYSLVSLAELAHALDWFKEIAAPLAYSGSLESNQLMPTALGVLRPTALVPETMKAGNLARGGDVLIVGLSGYRDFYPSLVAENLNAAALPGGGTLEARAVEVGLAGDQRDLRPQLLARRLEMRSVRASLGRAIRAELAHETVVGVPAVLGLEHSHEVWSDLEDLVGRPVFEIPTLPPSQPGLRLMEVLARALRRFGGRLQVGTTVTGVRAAAGRVESVVVAQASRQVALGAGQFVLASGGIGTGGVVIEPGGLVRESVFGLPLVGVPDDGQARFVDQYFSAQPLDRVGLRVDSQLRPLGPEGTPVYANLRAVGAALGGAAPWREKSGDGISLGTGFRAAAAILEGLS